MAQDGNIAGGERRFAKEVDSTMAWMQRCIDAGEGAHGLTLWAHHQDQGVGRHGRRWHAAAGAGLWFTTLVAVPKARTDDAHSLSLVAGVALCKALTALGATGIGLGWPNDLLVAAGDGAEDHKKSGLRKLGGILLRFHPHALAIPAASQDAVAIGIGINILPRGALELPEDIQGRYVGLTECLSAGTVAPKADDWLLDHCLGFLQVAYDQWCREGLGPTAEAFASLDLLSGRRVKWQTQEGMWLGLSARGEGRLLTATGEVLVGSGEILPMPSHSPAQRVRLLDHIG